MIENFAMTFTEIGLRKWQLVAVPLSIIIFPITFFISSKNFDAKSVYESMLGGSEDK
tara:strand:+ start:1875 stop:2045 length:171 start_codon:yes stop_codon:yes gene_type:complete